MLVFFFSLKWWADLTYVFNFLAPSYILLSCQLLSFVVMAKTMRRVTWLSRRVVTANYFMVVYHNACNWVHSSLLLFIIIYYSYYCYFIIIIIIIIIFIIIIIIIIIFIIIIITIRIINYEKER